MNIKSTVSEAERMGCEFIEVGDKVKVKVIDLQKEGEKLMKYRRENNMSNFVSIRATQAKIGVEYSYSHSYDKDYKSGIHYGILAGAYDDGNPKWYKINLKERETFDLEMENDRNKYLVMRMSPQVKDSPLDVGKSRFEIVDKELASKEMINKSKEMQTALNRVDKLTAEDAIRVSRYIGIPVDVNFNENEIKSNLINYVIGNPAGFNAKWDSPTRKFQEIISTGVALGVIKHDVETGYRFHSHAMGTSEYAVLGFFAKNLDVVGAVEAEIGEKDFIVNKFAEKSKQEEVKGKGKPDGVLNIGKSVDVK